MAHRDAYDRHVTADLTVVGGGIAGICAAVAAARQGLDTVLVNDRPVLGGNSSSEVRVWINGATGGTHNRYVREGGIVEEICLENRARNPDGNADLWDMVLHDLCANQAHLTVHLNLLIDDISCEGNTVEWVGGTQNMSETSFRFESPYFVDATGDGVLAKETGAEWLMGREGTSAYDEIAAPPEPDNKTLGSSIMFYSERRDEPIEYTPPDMAHDFKDNPPQILAQRADPDDRRCLYWWIEYGGQAEIDPIKDNEEIRDELWAIVYGAWDYIKNSGAFPEKQVEDLALEWTGKIPGKRESRRFMGDYVLTEGDLIHQRSFDDTVAHTGWSIDLHPPAGFYDDQGRGSEHWHLDGPAQVPYRILYPEGADNLFLAGRHVSASHVAFGSLRVQKTLGALGQAVGTAASLALQDGLSPAAVGEERIHELQQTLLREDQWVMGRANDDPTDLAREATVTASSHQPTAVRQSDTTVPLTDPLGIHLSTDEHVDSIKLLVEGEADTTVTAEVYSEERPENYVPNDLRRETHLDVPEGNREWVELPVDTDPGPGEGLFLVLRENELVRLHASKRRLPGVILGERSVGRHHGLVPDDHQRQVRWDPMDCTPCVALVPDPDLYAPAAVVDGVSRPHGVPHCWCSEQFAQTQSDHRVEPKTPVWLELSWPDPLAIDTVQLTFNSRLTYRDNPLTPMQSPAFPEIVRSYRIQRGGGDARTTIASVTGNYQRFRRHTFDPVETDTLRIAIDETNGAHVAQVFEIRVYGPDAESRLTSR